MPNELNVNVDAPVPGPQVGHAILDADEERAFRRLADTLPELIWAADSSGKLNYLGARWEKTLGLAHTGPKNAGGWPELLHPEDLMRVRTVWMTAMASGMAFDFEARLRPGPEAPYRWFISHGVPLRDDTGAVVRWVGSSTDITELKRAAEKDEEASQQLQMLLEHAPITVVNTDARGIYTAGAGAALSNLGVTKETIVGQSMIERTQGNAHIQGMVKRVLAGEELVWEDNHRGRNWQLHGVPVRTNTGELTGMAGILFDITARKQAERLAASERVQTEAANLKSQSLANMSHEIRTPLGGIMGITELLAETKLAPEARCMVDLMLRSGADLLKVVNEVLTYSKIEAGRMGIVCEPLSLRALLQEQVEAMGAALDPRGATLQLQVDPSLADRFSGDSGHLRAVLQYLLRYAVTVTPTGSITLQCKLLPDFEVAGATALRIDVVHGGPRLDETQIAGLFLPRSFTQSLGSQPLGGAGLGLAICRGLAELLGGNLNYIQNDDGTNTMQLDLILPHADDATCGCPAPDPAPGNHAPRVARILVAEDNLANQLITCSMLEKMGHSVTVVGSGRLALAALEAATFDLVLMDCHMPDLDGYEATAHIRSGEADSQGHLPILALTATDLVEEAAHCRAAGMDDMLTKPLSPQALSAALANWLPR
jgi:PAS domain S-box-containing protein